MLTTQRTEVRTMPPQLNDKKDKIMDKDYILNDELDNTKKKGSRPQKNAWHLLTILETFFLHIRVIAYYCAAYGFEKLPLTFTTLFYYYHRHRSQYEIFNF